MCSYVHVMLYCLETMRYLRMVNEKAWVAVQSYTLRYNRITASATTRQREEEQDAVCAGDRLLKPFEWYTRNLERLYDRHATWYG